MYMDLSLFKTTVQNSYQQCSENLKQQNLSLPPLSLKAGPLSFVAQQHLLGTHLVDFGVLRTPAKMEFERHTSSVYMAD